MCTYLYFQNSPFHVTMTKLSNEFDDVLNDYFMNNILKETNHDTTTMTEDNTPLPELLKGVKPSHSLSVPYSDLSKISTNTESGTDFLEKLLNGDSTGGVNSTGNVDYSKMDRQLNNYLDKSVKTDDSKNNETKENENPKKMGTLDDMAKFDSLRNDQEEVLDVVLNENEEEEDSWPNTSDVKYTNAEDETSPNYEEDFDDGEELELVTEKPEELTNEESVEDSELIGGIIKKITELEPNSEATLKNESENNVEIDDEYRGFDLSPIHSSALTKTPAESQNFGESRSFKNHQDFTESRGLKESKDFSASGDGHASPKRVSISVPIVIPRPTTATQQRKDFTQKTLSEKEKSVSSKKSNPSILRKKNADRYKHIESTGYNAKLAERKKLTDQKFNTRLSIESNKADGEIERLTKQLNQMKNDYQSSIKQAKASADQDLTKLQRENFILKSEIEKENKPKPFTDKSLINQLNIENDKLKKVEKEKLKEFDLKTDNMVKENLVLEQKLAMVQEERDKLKRTNKHLRSPRHVKSDTKIAEQEIYKTPEKFVRKSLEKHGLKTPEMVFNPYETHVIEQKNTTQHTDQNTQNTMNYQSNQLNHHMNPVLLPAFVALERQLTISQRKVEEIQLEADKKSAKIELLETQMKRSELEHDALNTRLADVQSALGERMTTDSHNVILKYGG